MVRLVLQGAPLPTNFRGTPQELYDAILDRVEGVIEGNTFVISDVAPAQNQGPWLKGGTKWYVWDTQSSTYIPLDTSDSVTAQFSIGPVAPDPSKQQFWFKTSGAELVGLFYYVGTTSGWVPLPKELSDKDGNPLPEVVRTENYKNGSVTGVKIASKTVLAANIQDDLPVSKLETGTARRVLRLNGATTPVPQWEDWEITGELSIASGVFHDTGFAEDNQPKNIRLSLKCVKTGGSNGYQEGVILSERMLGLGTVSVYPAFDGTSETWKIYVNGATTMTVKSTDGASTFSPSASNWKLLVSYENS